MNEAQSRSLTVNLGLCGYDSGKAEFVVSINSRRISELLEQARLGAKVYELFAIRRPGDIWDYLQIDPISLPDSVQRKAVRTRERTAAARVRYFEEERTEKLLSFMEFHRQFYRVYEDDTPDDSPDLRWYRYYDSDEPNDFVRAVFSDVQEVQSELRDGDALVRQEIGAIEALSHAYDQLPHSEWLGMSARSAVRGPPRHTAAFYEKLGSLLRVAVSAAYRGVGDYFVHRLFCLEQRRRADDHGVELRHAMYICSLCDGEPAARAWGARLWCFSEGLGPGELMVQDRDYGVPIHELVRRAGREFNYLLTDTRQEGLHGFREESGEGWWCYERQEKLENDASTTRTRRFSRENE